MDRYLVSTEDCLVLLAIQNASSVRQAAETLHCDPAGLLRKVQRISTDHGLLQKSNGKWTLTEAGLNVARWTRESIQSQKNILQSRLNLRIGSTVWLAEQLLIPNLELLQKEMPFPSRFEFSAARNSFELALLQGEIDFAITCTPPDNPLIAHRQIGQEPWVVAVSKKLVPPHVKLNLDSLSNIPFVAHNEINPDLLTNGTSTNLKTESLIRSDNLTTVRSAIVHGKGWSYVPKALLLSEIRAGHLATFRPEVKMNEKVCLCWLRESQIGRSHSETLKKWVSSLYELTLN